MSTALYVTACLVVPFVWGVLVYWIFSRIEEATARRPEESASESTRPAATERPSSMWDYSI
jgi:hypothetical protein